MNLTTTRSAKFTNTIVVEGSGSIARMIRKVGWDLLRNGFEYYVIGRIELSGDVWL